MNYKCAFACLGVVLGAGCVDLKPPHEGDSMAGSDASMAGSSALMAGSGAGRSASGSGGHGGSQAGSGSGGGGGAQGGSGGDGAQAGSGGSAGTSPEPTQCEELAAPDSGSVSVPGMSPGDIASYTCDPTFGLVGVASRTCQEDGTWSDEAPSCQPGDCPSPTSPNDGTVTTASGTAQGEDAVYACDEGHTLVGDDTRTCQADNTWSGEEPVCELVDCGTPDAPGDGAADASAGTTFGEVASYSCNAGHTLVGEATRTCQGDGTWSGSVPSCGPVDCGPLSAPGNGSLDAPSTTYGATATYSCSPGFGVVGQAARTCQADGTWSGSVPSCAPGDCSTPPAPTDGTVITPTGTTFGSVATYQCNAGHNLAGNMTRTCQADKTWSGALPTCAVVDCGSPTKPSNGNATAASGTTYGKTATYSCNTGRELNGNSTRTCQADGNWSGTLPSCTLVDCGDPPGPSGGPGAVSTPSDATTYNTVATYSCQTGYSVSGNTTRTCQANGNWSGSTPSCQLVSCGAPPGPSGPGTGSVSTPGSATTYNTVATYSCASGYDVSGNTTRTCQASGSWSGSTPSCQPVSCGTPPGPTGPGSGSVSTPNNATTYNTVATYSCQTNFALSGNTTRTCQADRSWGGSTPSCQLRLESLPGTLTIEGISPDGSVLVGQGSDLFAAKYRGGSVTSLGGFIGDTWSQAFAASTNGDVIVGLSERTNLSTGVTTTRAVKWTGTTVSELSKPAGAVNCSAIDVSADGTVIVGSCIDSTGSNQSIVRWLNGSPNVLNSPAGTTWCFEPVVSGDGTKIFGSCSVTGSVQPFTGTTQGLSIISTSQAGCRPLAVSTNGATAVGTCSTGGSSAKGFVYTSSGGLHVLAGSELLESSAAFTSVEGVSGNGTFSAGHTVASGSTVVVRWQSTTPHRISDLLSSRGVSTTGWTFSEAADISDDGSTIVGLGFLNGNQVGFIVRLN